MNILVLASAARESGALTIYRQFLSHLAEEAGSDRWYLVIDSAMPCPEIAGVGYTEERAKELGIEYIVGRFPTSANGRSLVAGCTGGMIKVLAGPKFGEILGVHILAPSATELIEEAALAIRLEATLDELTDTIHCHPTVAEALREAALAARKRAIHIPNKK